MSKQSIFDEVRGLFETAKAQEYLGEDITLIEHMVQCGDLAKSSRAPDWLVVAALLHDVGHILIPDAQEAQDAGSDRHHDEVGASWLAQRFPNNVVQAVKLHVDAKKYLVATSPEYFEKLSDASKATLKIQGGAFSARECEDFLRQDFADEAVQLRLWDDAAKVRGMSDASLDRFRDVIQKVAFRG